MAETKYELPIVGWVDPKELQELESGEPWTPLERENHDGISVPLTPHPAAQSRINDLLEALSLARETIARDREALYSTHFDYAVGRGNDDLGQQGIHEYDAVLAAIDRSLSGGEGGGNG